MNKKGQFFLLAAVIISAVIISLGVGTNKAVVNDEPGSFYDFSYDVQREVGAVLDYEVYTGFNSSVNLTEFVDLLANDISERSPGSDFIFIYGENTTDMEVRNYGSSDIYANGDKIKGSEDYNSSTICIEDICKKVSRDLSYNSIGNTGFINNVKSNSNNISVEVGGNDFEFPITGYKQVIFIMQKKVGGDRHVIVG